MKRKLLNRYVVLYLVIFCFLSTLLVPGYLILRRSIIKSFIATNSAILNDGVRRLEDRLQTVQIASRKLYEMADVQKTSRADKNLTPSDAYDILRVQELFRTVTSAVSDSMEFGMLQKNSSVFLNGSYFSNIEEVSAYFFYSESAGDLGAWINSHCRGNTPYIFSFERVHTIYGGTRNALLFAEQLPLNTKWNNTVSFAVIDENELVNMLAVGDALPHCSLSLAHPSGLKRTMHSNASGKCLNIQAESSVYQLSVEMDIEFSYVMRNLRTYTDFILLCFGAYIVTGALLLIYAANKNIKPLTRALDGADSILSEINGENSEHGRDLTEYFGKFMNFIHDKLAENKELLQIQKKELLSNRFELLLQNNLYVNDPIAEELISQLPEEWCMSLYQLGSTDDITPIRLSENQLFLQSQIAKEPDIVLHHFSENELILIFSSMREFVQISSRIYDALSAYDRQGEFKCIIGQPHRGTDLSSVYKHLHTLSRLNGAGCTVESNSHTDESVHLSPDFGRSLFEHILNGRPEAAEQLLQEQAELLIATSANEDDIAEFFFSCRCAINSLSSEMDIPIPPLNYIPAETLSECTNRLINYAHIISESSKDKRLASATEQERAVLMRINELISDCNLSSELICNEFGISVSSLQRLMHKLCGQTFLSFVESQRLKQAYDLIQSTDTPVKDIATGVGYASFNTFYKAFKKCYNLSPGSLRGDNRPEL